MFVGHMAGKSIAVLLAVASYAAGGDTLQVLIHQSGFPQAATGYPFDAPEFRRATHQAPLPSLTIHWPEIEVGRPTGEIGALLVFPGGGYARHAIAKEGHEVARWAASRGLAGIVVPYRCGGAPHEHPVPLSDARGAIQLVRSRADEWGIGPARIGVIGFSAGGHLAASAATLWLAADPSAAPGPLRSSSRPDFAALIYPVISMRTSITHRGSQRRLLGEDPGEELIAALSADENVGPSTPPTLLIHSTGDATVPVANSERFYQACREHGVPVEAHFYNTGGHGYGMRAESGTHAAWPLVLESWLEAHGYAEHRPSDFDVPQIERTRVLSKAERYVDVEVRTVTADSCPRSAGGLHDFYSEGDYWWPDPSNPAGKYIRRDGETNPDNFVEHRRSMIRLSEIVGALVSAYRLTGDERFASSSVKHLRAWFIDESTGMEPSLLYGQAIQGRYTGRSIGIIDTIHLAEVARGAKILIDSGAMSEVDASGVTRWFQEYLTWINTHEYGLKEKSHPNNHGVCWSMQAAAFADLVGDEEVLAWVREQFRTVYLPKMMNADGAFPAELARTKPYGYSLFTIDAMATIAQIVSTVEEDLWKYETPDGRGMRLGLRYIAPYVSDKSQWPLPPDVQHWDDWPVRHPSLLFAGLRYATPHYLTTWRRLDADPRVFEVLRNLPIRHPLLWVHVDAAIADDE